MEGYIFQLDYDSYLLNIRTKIIIYTKYLIVHIPTHKKGLSIESLKN